MSLPTRLSLIAIAILMGLIGVLAIYLWPYRDSIAHGTLIFLLVLGALIVLACVIGLCILVSKAIHAIGKVLHAGAHGFYSIAERHQSLRHAEDKHQVFLRENYLNQDTVIVRQGESLFTRGYQHSLQTHHLAQLPSGADGVDTRQPLNMAQMPVAPAFRDMKHLISPGRLPLAWGVDGPIDGTVKDLLSMLFVGKPGRGKSVGLLYYIAMLLLSNATVWIFDPQGSLNELESVLNYRSSPESITESIPVIYEEIKKREELWRKGIRTFDKPLLILIDELVLLAAWAKKHKPEYDVLDLIHDIVLYYRKYEVYCIVAGQAVPATVLETLTRDCMSSRLVFFSSDVHARMAGLDKESQQRLLPALRKAKPGTAILDVSAHDEPELAAIPFTTIDDIVAIIESKSTLQSHHDDQEEQCVPAGYSEKDTIDATYRVIEEGPRYQQLPPAFYRHPIKLQGDLLMVYRAVLTHRTTNKRQLASKVGMDESKVYRLTQQLKEAGYLKK